MNITVLSAMTMLLMGCTGTRSTGPCGDSFCLPPDAQLLSKETPVEDFNLYQVGWRGAQFGIYEGNHPQGQRDRGRTIVRLSVDRAARLRVSDGRGSILVDTGNDGWPAYLDVMGPCRSTKECMLKSFADELRLRT